jgi:hypothetical protein
MFEALVQLIQLEIVQRLQVDMALVKLEFVHAMHTLSFEQVTQLGMLQR